jgi:hypothetical protein
MYIYQINGVIINGEVIEKTGTIQILRWWDIYIYLYFLYSQHSV